jgi:hypothetical protein
MVIKIMADRWRLSRPITRSFHDGFWVDARWFVPSLKVIFVVFLPAVRRAVRLRKPVLPRLIGLGKPRLPFWADFLIRRKHVLVSVIMTLSLGRGTCGIFLALVYPVISIPSN